MPVLDFLTEFDPQDNDSRVWTGIRLNAVMLYPSNWQLREELIVFRTVEWEQTKSRRQEGSPVAPITNDPKINLWLSRLVDMQRRNFGSVTHKHTHQGILAGRRLYFVAGLEFHGAGGSFNHSDELIPYKKLHDIEGKIISTAKGAIHQAWKTFQNVSHLWAAEEILHLEYPDDKNVPEFYPELLIPIAEWFRLFGEDFCPGNTQTPILDSEATWKAPPEFNFPRFDADDYFSKDKFRDFTPEMLSKL